MTFPLHYIEHVAKTRERLQLEREAQLRLFDEPRPKQKYLAETIVEGKTVAEWAKQVEVYIARETKLIQALPVPEAVLESDLPPLRPTLVLDLVSVLSPAVSCAVDTWREAGCPTEYDETAAAIKKLHNQAEAQTALATMEEGNAEEFSRTTQPKKAAQHSRYALNHREKASKLLQEADKLIANWKKKHS